MKALQKFFGNGEKLTVIILNIIVSFASASVIMCMISNADFMNVEYSKTVSVVLLAVLFLSVLAVLCVIDAVLKLRGIPALITAVLSAFALTSFVSENVYFTLTLCVALLFLMMFLCQRKLIPMKLELSRRATNLLVVFVFVCVAGFTAYACAMRSLSYKSSNFDMGIFTQMYESIIATGRADTTTERNKLMSHFCVHVSPILYTLAPLYRIFRSSAFLAAVQPFIVLSGVFPLMKIVRMKHQSEAPVLFFSLAMLMYPAFVSPCYYDFHENIFFTPLLLWLLYFVEKDNKAGVAVFTVLTLCVKEEAGLYVGVIGLWSIFGLKKRKTGIAMIIAAAVHFVLAISLIRLIGGENLSSAHYGNLIPSGESGVGAVIRTIFLSPVYVVSQLLNPDKIKYLLLMFLPTLFLPFRTKRFSLLFLLVPLLMMNIMTSYSYQYNIGYQYSFASGALILYMCAVGGENDKAINVKSFACFVMSLLICTNVTFTRADMYIKGYHNGIDNIKQSDEILEDIPTDASVTAATFLIPKLSKVKELYMLRSTDENITTDYVIIDKRYENEFENVVTKLAESGYELVGDRGFVKVYKNDASAP